MVDLAPWQDHRDLKKRGEGTSTFPLLEGPAIVQHDTPADYIALLKRAE